MEPVKFNVEEAHQLAQESKKLAEAEQENLALDAFPPLTADQTRVKGRLIAEPSPREYILNYKDEGLIPADIVGALVGLGGAGKSMLVLHIANILASGGQLGPLRAVKPVKVLVLAGEDPQSELHRRLWALGQGQFHENLHVESVAGKVGPLMYLNGNKPERSERYKWLEDTIEAHSGLQVLIIDPKSRFYGLDENNNDHATQWVACLEALARKYNLTILFSHHVSKARAETLTQFMSRGGQALADGCRWVAGMKEMDDNTAKRYEITDQRQYIEFDVLKSNYCSKLPSSIYFKRSDAGLFEFINLEADRLKSMVNNLCDLLSKTDDQYSRNDLIFKKNGKPIADEMKEMHNNFNRRKDIAIAIEYALKEGLLEQVESFAASRGRPKEILQVSRS